MQSVWLSDFCVHVNERRKKDSLSLVNTSKPVEKKSTQWLIGKHTLLCTFPTCKKLNTFADSSILQAIERSARQAVKIRIKCMVVMGKIWEKGRRPMAWEWGNQWLAGLFLDGLHLHLNLFKVRPPTPSEQPSMTQPGSQLLAHRSREKKTPWWPGDKEHIAALCIRGGRSSWRKERGLRWEFFSRSICCILNAPHLYLSWRTRVLRPNGEKRKHWQRLCSELAPGLWVTDGVYFLTD